MNINNTIEEMLESNASDFEISKIFKKYIKDYNNSIHETFEQNQGKDFLVKHTREIDKLITLMFKSILRKIFGIYLPMRGSIPITLVALGSYGREQLCVHSDIDLLIVYEEIEGYNTNAIIERFLYLAWDSGFKLGHRVHEIKDLFKASNEDITIKTALLEMRYIFGSTFTWQNTTREIEKIRHHKPLEYIESKISEAHTRQAKNPFSMQPQIKEGVGGLRDSNLLYWVNLIANGSKQLKDLAPKFYSEESYKEYRSSLELIFRVRSALHIVTSKQQDKLSLEYIPEISELLGFNDHMKFVTKLLGATQTINLFSKINVKRLQRVYLFNNSNISKLKKHKLEKNYYFCDNTIYTSFKSKDIYFEDILDIFSKLPDQKIVFDESILYVLNKANFKYETHQLFNELLLEIFAKEFSYQYIKLFYEADVLHTLIPSFKKVQHLPQFDGYHSFSVDMHSVECLNALENIQNRHIKDIYLSMSAKDKVFLKIVILLHDTGKGRQQDHSAVGVKIISSYLKILNFSDEEQEIGMLLVKHHTLMSNIAFRENIHSEKTLYKFMSQIKDLKNLKMLYVLTYADINGVGENIYNSFNERLLQELYDYSLEVIDQEDRISDASKRLSIEKKIQKSPSFQLLNRTMQKKVLSIESNLFYFKNSIEDIFAISQSAKSVKDYDYTISNNGTLKIEIFRKTPLNLGYLLGKLSYLDVVSMEIFTLFDDVKYFKIEFVNVNFTDTYETFDHIIKDSFNMNSTIELKKPNIKNNELSLDCEHSKSFAELKVFTSNQKGLLAYIVSQFDKNNINIATAKIHSTKKRVRDNFLIEKDANMCDNTKMILDLLNN